jgi:hypothetical protein
MRQGTFFSTHSSQAWCPTVPRKALLGLAMLASVAYEKASAQDSKDLDRSILARFGDTDFGFVKVSETQNVRPRLFD